LIGFTAAYQYFDLVFSRSTRDASGIFGVVFGIYEFNEFEQVVGNEKKDEREC
jgi:hypothetical protein